MSKPRLKTHQNKMEEQINLGEASIIVTISALQGKEKGV